MMRLRQVKPRELIHALVKAGFQRTDQIGSHVILFDERRDIQTSVPMHRGDVGRGLLKKILKQAELSEEQLRKLL